MAFATLEDDVNKIELTLFPRIYNQFLNIKNGMIIIVSGHVSMRNQLQIVVEDIEILWGENNESIMLRYWGN